MADNASFTFDEDGNPIPRERPPSSASSTKKPPSGRPKKSRKQRHKNADADSSESTTSNISFGVRSEEAFANGEAIIEKPEPQRAEPVADASLSQTVTVDEPMTDMFHIDGTGYDVTLSPALQKIHWECMNPGKQDM
jgi:hypothetical protein